MTSSPIFALSKEQGKSMKPPMRSVLSAVFLVSLVMPILRAQVLNDRLLRAAAEPHNWMMYSGTYASQRYSTLSQINPSNVKNLEQKWIFQADSLEKFETTPLVVDGIMYITQAPSDVIALDAKTGRVFWIYRYYPSRDTKPCCGSVNRGLAIVGDTLFLATLDAHLVALDAKSGRPLWNVRVANASAGYAMTLAPLVVKDTVIVGVAGGEFLAGAPFVKVNWASGLDKKGRPIATPQPDNAPTYPGVQGATNWYSPSYSPHTGLFYVSAWEDYGSVFVPEMQKYEEGKRFVGGPPTSAVRNGQNVPGLKRGPINTWTDAAGHGAGIAV